MQGGYSQLAFIPEGKKGTYLKSKLLTYALDVQKSKLLTYVLDVQEKARLLN